MNKILALCLSPDQGGLELYVLKLVNYYYENGQNIPIACLKESYIAQNTNTNLIECSSGGLFKNISNFFLIRKYIINNNISIIDWEFFNAKPKDWGYDIAYLFLSAISMPFILKKN